MGQRTNGDSVNEHADRENVASQLMRVKESVLNFDKITEWSTYRNVRGIRRKSWDILIRCKGAQGWYILALSTNIVNGLEDRAQISVGCVEGVCQNVVPKRRQQVFFSFLFFFFLSR